MSDENLTLTHNEGLELQMYLVPSAHDRLIESSHYCVTRLMFEAKQLARSWHSRENAMMLRPVVGEGYPTGKGGDE